jgi:hypothetical protein
MLSKFVIIAVRKCFAKVLNHKPLKHRHGHAAQMQCKMDRPTSQKLETRKEDTALHIELI